MYLNFGAGSIRPDDGWVNIDIAPDAQFIADGAALPFRDEVFDGGYANHSLCAIAWHDLTRVLDEIHRVMRPGAIFRASVPDIPAAFRAWENEDLDWFPQGDDLPTIDEKFSTYVTWFGTNLTPFTVGSLAHVLSAAGFSPVVRRHALMCTDPKLTELEDRLGESIFMDAWRSA